MIKKIIIYHLFLFLIVSLFSCTTLMDNVAPKPVEKDNKFVGQVLRSIITNGIDFWPGGKDFIPIYIEQEKL